MEPAIWFETVWNLDLELGLGFCLSVFRERRIGMVVATDSVIFVHCLLLIREWAAWRIRSTASMCVCLIIGVVVEYGCGL